MANENLHIYGMRPGFHTTTILALPHKLSAEDVMRKNACCTIAIVQTDCEITKDGSEFFEKPNAGFGNGCGPMKTIPFSRLASFSAEDWIYSSLFEVECIDCDALDSIQRIEYSDGTVCGFTVDTIGDEDGCDFGPSEYQIRFGFRVEVNGETIIGEELEALMPMLKME